MRGETILGVLRSRARRDPEKLAVAYAASGRTLTYGGLIERVQAWAGFFADRYRDARPLLTLPNDEPAVEALLGALAAGAAPVLADPALSPRERRALARGCASRAFLRRLPASPPAPGGLRPATPADGVVLITHTSGTTASPKGIAMTHETILARCRAVTRALRGDPSMRVLYHMPLAHGSMIPCLYTLYCGGTFVLDAPFTLDRLPSFWRTVDENGVTDVHTVPSVVRALLEFPSLRGDAEARALRRVFSTGSRLPEGTPERFRNRFGVPLSDCYGLKETAFAVVAGRAIVPMAAVDERGRRLPTGRVGVLAMAGPTVAPGYCRGRDLDRSTWRGRWFPTRDLGSVDAGGRVRLLGRADDVVITRDLKVWPEEVESVLRRHPGVADAAVLGLPDSWRGSRLVACVAAAGRRPSTESLLKHCRRGLSAHKVPVEFRLVGSIPRTTLGKVRRSALERCFRKGAAL